MSPEDTFAGKGKLDDLEAEEELEDLRVEIERFKKEKERVRKIVGKIGGVPTYQSKLANYVIAILIGICLIVSLMTHDDVIRLAMIELAVAILSLKLIYVIHMQSRVNHFQLWVLTALEWRLNEVLKELQEIQQEDRAERQGTASS